ncbi:uncharacterized protein I303_100979 [Kwoniella dejecticola CBS 10117]|uniref:Kinase n=1 Tax=Kwoniella dejecticola CBS 10117 TaxID=1296121 RepID=A0A1A6AGF9_9TREE|nr:uncharacterized protein I303_00983 [Kwoniella dejecticola CBS 10117]OBR89160.1 hypothetical protein I303_00983 [Kwoniella dejecticola CBS 10117]
MPSPPADRVMELDIAPVFGESMGMGTRKPSDYEEMVDIFDEDGSIMRVPKDEYFASPQWAELPQGLNYEPDQSKKGCNSRTSDYTIPTSTSSSTPDRLTTKNLLRYNHSGSSLATLRPVRDGLNQNEYEDDAMSMSMSIPDMESDDEADYGSTDSVSMLNTPGDEIANLVLMDPSASAGWENSANEPVKPSVRINDQVAIRRMSDDTDDSPQTQDDIDDDVFSGWPRESHFNNNDDEEDESSIRNGPPSWVLGNTEFETGGGHGMSVSPDGSRIIKPTHDGELEFYARIESDDPPLRALAPLVPHYYGAFNRCLPVSTDTEAKTSLLHHQSQSQSQRHPTGHSVSKNRDAKVMRPRLTRRGNTSDGLTNTIILENLKQGFKPDTISEFDLKLGREMVDPYAPDSTPYKISRMAQQVEESTSSSHAIRLVWASTAIKDLDTGEYTQVKTDKNYGKTLKRGAGADDLERANNEDLNDAFVRLFPSPGDTIEPKGDASKTAGQGCAAYDDRDNCVEKYYQDFKITNENNLDYFSIPTTNRWNPRQSQTQDETNWLFPNPKTEEFVRSQELEYAKRQIAFDRGIDILRPDMKDLSTLNKQKDQISDTIITMKGIKRSLEGMKDTLSGVWWRFKGSSVYVVHGEVDEARSRRTNLNEDQFEAYCELVNTQSAVSSANQYHEQRRGRVRKRSMNTDTQTHAASATNQYHEQRRGRVRKRSMNTDTQTHAASATLPEFKYFSPFHYGTHRSKVRLIDFARTHRDVGPDTDFIEGVTNTITLLDHRMDTLSEEKRTLEKEIGQMSKAIMKRSTFANPFTNDFKRLTLFGESDTPKSRSFDLYQY